MQFLKSLTKSELYLFANVSLAGFTITHRTTGKERKATSGFGFPTRLSKAGVRHLFLARCRTLRLNLRTIVDQYRPFVLQHRDDIKKTLALKRQAYLAFLSRAGSLLRVGMIFTLTCYDRTYDFRIHSDCSWQFQVVELVPCRFDGLIIPRFRLLTEVTPMVTSILSPHAFLEAMRHGIWQLIPYQKEGSDLEHGVMPFFLQMFCPDAKRDVKSVKVNIKCSNYLTLLRDARQSLNQSRREGLVVLAGHMQHNPHSYFYHIPRALCMHITSFLSFSP